MKTTIMLISLVSLFISSLVVATTRAEMPRAKLTVHVIGENGEAVGGALVRVAFCEKLSSRQSMVDGITDTNGLFTAEGHSEIKLSADARKDGYYISGAAAIDFYDATNGHWLPWNPTATTILRPIGKPVALYAKIVQTDVPALNEPCGFDLMKGDWVTPHGKGTTADFIFTISREVRDYHDFDAHAELTFAQPLDGLQESPTPAIATNSVFRWERQSPVDGYKPKLQMRNAWFPEGSGKKPIRTFKGQDEWQAYFFRIRTVEKDGKITSAHYGKIRGDIAIDPRDSKTCTIIFTYYLNPTPLDRNLEWDTKRNLLSGLGEFESPRDP